MGYVYRYKDLVDNIIKYVGIVWSGKRTLNQRLYEHQQNDEWCFKRRWKIEYLESEITTRTDAEYFESHYISLYETDKYFNVKKSGWGISSFLPNRENEWKEVVMINEELRKQKFLLNKIEKETEREILKYEKVKVELAKLLSSKSINLYSSGEKINIEIQDIIEVIEKEAIKYRQFTYDIATKSSIEKWNNLSIGCLMARNALLNQLLGIDKHFLFNNIHDIEYGKATNVRDMLFASALYSDEKTA